MKMKHMFSSLFKTTPIRTVQVLEKISPEPQAKESSEPPKYEYGTDIKELRIAIRILEALGVKGEQKTRFGKTRP